MTTRRRFVISGGLADTGLIFGSLNFPLSAMEFSRFSSFDSKRPPRKDRKFVSEAVEETILKTRKEIADPEIAWMFENCYPNTLDTTIKYHSPKNKPDTCIISDDIDAVIPAACLPGSILSLAN